MPHMQSTPDLDWERSDVASVRLERSDQSRLLVQQWERIAMARKTLAPQTDARCLAQIHRRKRLRGYCLQRIVRQGRADASATALLGHQIALRNKLIVGRLHGATSDAVLLGQQAGA